MRLELTPKQSEFAKAALSGEFLYLLFGGAIRGGKTVAALALLFVLAKVYPGSRWAIVRKDLPTLKRNTVPSFERHKPRPFVGEINKSDWIARCANGSVIMFFAESFKDDPELNRWRGLEVNGFVLEEANELTEAAFNKAIERAGTWRCEGSNQPPPLVLLTCNPSKNWIKRRFHDPWAADILRAPYYYCPAKITDNPHNPPAYVRALENLPPADYARFVEGRWDAADDPDQLIKYEWIVAAMNLEPTRGKAALGVDVARFGNDDTVLAERSGPTLVQLDYYSGLSTDRTADIVQARMTNPEHPIDAGEVRIDVVGLGAGVADNLKREGFEIVEIVSGARAVEREGSFYRFKNLRSQMWWEYREALRNGEAPIDIDDPRLFEDLTAPRYSVSGDKVITVESKDEIRRRIGRSTDAGDGVVYCYHEPAVTVEAAFV